MIVTTSLSPFPDDDFKPRGVLHKYDDGHSIAAVELAPHGLASLNLGQLDDAQAVEWLLTLAEQAKLLAVAIDESSKAVKA